MRTDTGYHVKLTSRWLPLARPKTQERKDSVAKTWKTILVYRFLDQELENCARKYLRGNLIDIGCGTKPYKRMLARYVTQHIGVDRLDPFNKKAERDIIATAYRIPVADESFDCAISIAVLEHLAEPEEAVRECYRVLKKGGVAVYAVPFIWQLHAEPWDYYRFSKYGLQHLFEKVGFEPLEITPLAGFWVTMATMSCYYIERFNRGLLRRARILPALGICLQWIAGLLQKLDSAEEWTWMYTVVARK